MYATTSILAQTSNIITVINPLEGHQEGAEPICIDGIGLNVSGAVLAVDMSGYT